MQNRISQYKTPEPLAAEECMRRVNKAASVFPCPGLELRNELFAHAARSNGAFEAHLIRGTPSPEVIEERNRVAREIHDTLAQEFAGILLHLEAAKRADPAEPHNIFAFLGRARELAKCGLEDARRMLLGLRPKSLEGGNLPEALRQLAEAISRDFGIACAFSISGRVSKLPEAVEDELYRVAQEALCNVRKHSRAACVSMVLNYRSAGVVLAIKDDGQGFVPRQPQVGMGGFGLPGMCDRANRLGGRMDINSEPGAGTEVTMTVPLAGKSFNERNRQ